MDSNHSLMRLSLLILIIVEIPVKHMRRFTSSPFHDHLSIYLCSNLQLMEVANNDRVPSLLRIHCFIYILSCRFSRVQLNK